MGNLSSDADFKKKLKKIVKVARDDLWKELHEIASFLALIGDMEEATALWKFMYSGAVPVPGQDNQRIDAFGDGTISAVCHQLGIDDISLGMPAPKAWLNGKTAPLEGPLAVRVKALDRYHREMLTIDPWCGEELSVQDSKPHQIADKRFQQMLNLAHPGRGKQYSRSELKALQLFRRFLDDAQTFGALFVSYQATAFLIAADIAARNDRGSIAVEYVQKWYDCEDESSFRVGEAFALISVAEIICKGGLSTRLEIPAQTRQKMVRSLIEDLTTRLSKAEPARPPKWKHKVLIDHNQFYLEPLEADPGAIYFQIRGESDQGFSSFPRQVALCTPEDTCECQVEAEIGTSMPVIKSAVQAVAVPLIVPEPGGLFIRSILDDGSKLRLEIPAGNYVVFARLFPHKPKASEESGFNSWRVVLTFLPKGTVSPSCLKLFDGTPPAEVFLND